MSFYDPFRELYNLRREFERIFDGRIPGVHTSDKRISNLSINVAGNEDGYTTSVLAPGVDPKTIEVSVHKNRLSVSAERPAVEEKEGRNWHRRERATGRFERTITLPDEINSDAVKAEYLNGILYVTLPKAESVKPKQIAVSVA